MTLSWFYVKIIKLVDLDTMIVSSVFNGGCNHGCFFIFNIIEYTLLLFVACFVEDFHFSNDLFIWGKLFVGFSRLLRRVLFDFEARNKEKNKIVLGVEGFGFELVIRVVLMV